MKGLTGLVIAGALGVLAVGVNMAYLHNKTKNIDTVQFVGIKSGQAIQTGEVIRKEFLEPVPIPTNRAESLKEYVYLWADRGTISGTPATRLYRGGELLLLADYRTPPPKLVLGSDEILLPVDVAHRSPLIEPGDMVSFLIPSAPARTVRSGTLPPDDALPASPPIGSDPDIHGPFRVAALGNRIASRAVMKAYKIPVQSENQLGIIVKLDPPDAAGKRKLQADARNLVNALTMSNSRNIRVILHSDAEE